MPDNEQKTPSRQAFEEWYVTQAFDYAENPLGSRNCQLQWEAWQAAGLEMIRMADETYKAARDEERLRESENFILKSALRNLNKKVEDGIKFSDALDRVLLLFGSITKDELVAAYDAQEPKRYSEAVD